MKKLLTILFVFISAASFAQLRPLVFVADTIKVYSNSANKATLQIVNQTKDVLGFLYNKGNGVTEFRPAARQINPTQWVFGNDTINIANGATYRIGANYDITKILLYENSTAIDSMDITPATPVKAGVNTYFTYSGDTLVINSSGGGGGVDNDADSLGGHPASYYVRYIDTAAMLLPYRNAINKNVDSITAHNNRLIAMLNTLDSSKINLRNEIAGKQATLVSGTNIKTINGGSILGSGNIATLIPADSIYIHGKLFGTFGKNAARDSFVLVLNDGSRYAAKDSIGGGGPASIATLTDVNLTSIANNQTLVYNTSTSKWLNKDIALISLAGIRNNDIPLFDSTNNQWYNWRINLTASSGLLQSVMIDTATHRLYYRPAGSTGWGLTLNTGTDSTINAIGTGDSTSLMVKVNNKVKMSIQRNAGDAVKFGDHTGGAGLKSISIEPSTNGSFNMIRFFQSGGYSNTIRVGGSELGFYRDLASAYGDIHGLNGLFDRIVASTQYTGLTIEGSKYVVGSAIDFKSTYSPNPIRMRIYTDANSEAPIVMLPSGNASVIIGGDITDTVKSAELLVKSVLKGSIPAPRMTTAQRLVITSGLVTGTRAGGSGGTNGAYTQAFTGGSGSSATGTFTVSGGAVTSVVVTIPGSGYAIGDILSTTISGLTGFTYTISQLTGTEGILVWDTTLHKLYGYDGTAWNAAW